MEAAAPLDAPGAAPAPLAPLRPPRQADVDGPAPPAAELTAEFAAALERSAEERARRDAASERVRAWARADASAGAAPWGRALAFRAAFARVPNVPRNGKVLFVTEPEAPSLHAWRARAELPGCARFAESELSVVSFGDRLEFPVSPVRAARVRGEDAVALESPGCSASLWNQLAATAPMACGGAGGKKATAKFAGVVLGRCAAAAPGAAVAGLASRLATHGWMVVDGAALRRDRAGFVALLLTLFRGVDLARGPEGDVVLCRDFTGIRTLLLQRLRRNIDEGLPAVVCDPARLAAFAARAGAPAPASAADELLACGGPEALAAGKRELQGDLVEGDLAEDEPLAAGENVFAIPPDQPTTALALAAALWRLSPFNPAGESDLVGRPHRPRSQARQALARSPATAAWLRAGNR